MRVCCYLIAIQSEKYINVYIGFEMHYFSKSHHVYSSKVGLYDLLAFTHQKSIAFLIVLTGMLVIYTVALNLFCIDHFLVVVVCVWSSGV